MCSMVGDHKCYIYKKKIGMKINNAKGECG